MWLPQVGSDPPPEGWLSPRGASCILWTGSSERVVQAPQRRCQGRSTAQRDDGSERKAALCATGCHRPNRTVFPSIRHLHNVRLSIAKVERVSQQAQNKVSVAIGEEPGDGGRPTGRFGVSVAGRYVAWGCPEGEPIGSSFVTGLELDPSLQVDFGEVAAVASAMMLRYGQSSSIVFDIADPLLRYIARRGGFTGGLRRELRLPSVETLVRVVAATRSAAATHPIDAIYRQPAGADRGPLLAASVNKLLRYDAAVAHEPRGWAGRIRDTKMSGNLKSLRLTVNAWSGASFDVVVPDSEDLMPEAVAMACDMITRTHARFPRELGGFRLLAFDRSHSMFSAGHVAAVARGAVGEIHVSDRFVRVEEYLKWRNRQVERRLAPISARLVTLADGVASNLDYWSRAMLSREMWRMFFDGIVAHELWHLIDRAFSETRYEDSIEFRRRLGKPLRVESLHDGLFDDAAVTRLRQQVSHYATTNESEATAEMFREWWWWRGWYTPQSVSHMPLVEAFGELIDEFLPTGRHRAEPS